MQTSIEALGTLSDTGTPIHKVTVTVRYLMTMVRSFTLLGSSDRCAQQAQMRFRLEFEQIAIRPGVSFEAAPEAAPGLRVDPRSFGYRIEGPGNEDDKHLQGRYWWSITRDDVSHRVSSAEFPSADEALADARREFYEEIARIFKPRKEPPPA